MQTKPFFWSTFTRSPASCMTTVHRISNLGVCFVIVNWNVQSRFTTANHTDPRTSFYSMLLKKTTLCTSTINFVTHNEQDVFRTFCPHFCFSYFLLSSVLFPFFLCRMAIRFNVASARNDWEKTKLNEHIKNDESVFFIHNVNGMCLPSPYSRLGALTCFTPFEWIREKNRLLENTTLSYHCNFRVPYFFPSERTYWEVTYHQLKAKDDTIDGQMIGSMISQILTGKLLYGFVYAEFKSISKERFESYPVNTCICGATHVVNRCAECQNVHYCSKQCQRDDWNSHKITCKKPCVICKARIIGYGNNAQPLADGECCDGCNPKVVAARYLSTKNQ